MIQFFFDADTGGGGGGGSGFQQPGAFNFNRPVGFDFSVPQANVSVPQPTFSSGTASLPPAFNFSQPVIPQQNFTLPQQQNFTSPIPSYLSPQFSFASPQASDFFGPQTALPQVGPVVEAVPEVETPTVASGMRESLDITSSLTDFSEPVVPLETSDLLFTPEPGFDPLVPTGGRMVAIIEGTPEVVPGKGEPIAPPRTLSYADANSMLAKLRPETQDLDKLNSDIVDIQTKIDAIPRIGHENIASRASLQAEMDRLVVARDQHRGAPEEIVSFFNQHKEAFSEMSAEDIAALKPDELYRVVLDDMAKKVPEGLPEDLHAAISQAIGSARTSTFLVANGTRDELHTAAGSVRSAQVAVDRAVSTDNNRRFQTPAGPSGSDGSYTYRDRLALEETKTHMEATGLDKASPSTYRDVERHLQRATREVEGMSEAQLATNQIIRETESELSADARKWANWDASAQQALSSELGALSDQFDRDMEDIAKVTDPARRVELEMRARDRYAQGAQTAFARVRDTEIKSNNPFTRRTYGGSTKNWEAIMGAGAFGMMLLAPFERQMMYRQQRKDARKDWERQKDWAREQMELQHGYRMGQIGAQGEASQPRRGTPSGVNVARF